MNDELYYGIEGQRFGPVSLERLQDMAKAGRLSPEDYIWDGPKQLWIRAAEYPGLFEDLEQHLPGEEAAVELPVFAGFWVRLMAHIIDSLVLFIPKMIWDLGSGIEAPPLLMPDQIDPAMANQYFEGFLKYYAGIVFIEWIYFALLESSVWQATIGKRALGIKVIDGHGRRLSFGRASGRYFAKILSALTLFFGFLMIAITETKQGLHDRIADTYCLRP